MFSDKYDLSGPIKWIQSTDEVRQRTSSHLATIISLALLPQDGRIPCPVDMECVSKNEQKINVRKFSRELP